MNNNDSLPKPSPKFITQVIALECNFKPQNILHKHTLPLPRQHPELETEQAELEGTLLRVLLYIMNLHSQAKPWMRPDTQFKIHLATKKHFKTRKIKHLVT